MLRNYTFSQVAEKLNIDDSELKYLVHHFRECLSTFETDPHVPALTEQDLLLLTRASQIISSEGMDPGEVRQRFIEEQSQSQMSGQRQAHLIAFCSGRLGTGKSSLVYNLATALAVRGSRCAIFSAGNNFYDRFFPVTGESTPPWNCRLNSGVQLISGRRYKAAMAAGSLDDEETLKLLNAADANLDFILADTGPGELDSALRYAMLVDETVIVTNPDVGANTDCFAIIQILRDVDPSLRISIILNRATNLGEARQSFARINGAAGKQGMGEISGLGWVAEDEDLRTCTAKGEAVVTALPNSLASRCLLRMADYLMHRLALVQRNSSSGTAALLRACQAAAPRET